MTAYDDDRVTFEFTGRTVTIIVTEITTSEIVKANSERMPEELELRLRQL